MSKGFREHPLRRLWTSLTAGSLFPQGANGKEVELPIGTAGQVLTVNAGETAPEWADATGGGGGASSVAELTDVDLTGLDDQYLLVYDEATSMWLVRLLTESDAPWAIPKSIIDAKGDLIVGTAADTPAKKTVGANNTVLTADSTQTDGLRWGTISATARTLWDVYQPFSSPSSQDDELEADKTTFDARYTLVNWAGLTSYDVVRGKLIAVCPVSNTLQRHALYALPSGDFTVWTHVQLNGSFSGGNSFAGFGLTDGTTNGAGNQVFAFLQWLNSSNIFTRGCNRYTNFTGASAATLKTAENGSEASAFIRYRRSGTNYFVAFSHDGIQWDESAAFTLAWTATFFGFAMRVDTSSAGGIASWDFLRYVASATAVLGESITLGLGQQGQTGATGPAGKGGIGFQFGDGLTTITGSGYKGMGWAAFDGLITEIRLKADASCSAVVEIKKNGTTIFTSVSPIALVSAASVTISSMTGIDTAVAEDDEYEFSLTSLSGTPKRITAQLFIERSP